MKNGFSSNFAADTITLVHSGRDYFDRLLKLINEATSEIHFQTYILEDDITGNKIANALKKAALRKVNIYLLLDGLGSRSLPDEFVADLQQSGIHFRFFAPLLSYHSFYFGRRLHHKIIVADAKTVLIGGINIAEKYDRTSTEAPWLDYAVLINDSSIAQQAQSICYYYFFKKRKRPNGKILPGEINNRNTIKLIQNDWLRRKNEIQNAYLKSIQTAQSEIIIVCGYFLPGRKLTQALKRAAQRNVRIRLILSEVSDVPLVKSAINYYYAFLLKNNIELYEWRQSILHGKTAVVDKKWTTIGSFNLNHLSSQASIEMNTSINSELFAENYRNHLIDIMSKCKQITSEAFQNRNGKLIRFKQWISYYVVRFFEILLTYLPHKRFLKGSIK
ncbi:hypothetical protein FEDK69T_13410 [Flavobacterium enshiense DK69]|uniref:phospholipase D-like domain-containing protein n=1 Tax=Flavobacterium enshiense TaxID=1341165 RepID=UPI0003C619E5|nr:phospholipase D-like domain-containing protein [Flavobacterium enshiense]ESU23189.1 hypothetical protein FEDK69T_13410 [Flavobacterium enshiense DK69]